MTRPMAIKWLKWIQNMFPEDSEQYKALTFGIDSLEVDEAYQLLYEKTTGAAGNKGTSIIDECAFCPYDKDEAVKKERNRWIGKLYDLKDKIRDEHEQYWEAERYDDAYGLSVASDMIDVLIKEELNGCKRTDSSSGEKQGQDFPAGKAGRESDSGDQKAEDDS